MSSSQSGPAGAGKSLPSARPALTWLALLGFTGVFTFVATEVLAMSAAAVWAVSGLFQLGHIAVIVLAVVVAIPALWALAMTAWLAWRSEVLQQ